MTPPKVCVVTGASSGIGEATARALARSGAEVVLAARREDHLARCAAEIGPRASWVRCDVTSLEDVLALRDHVADTHGRCDVVVNNAGVPGGGRFADLSVERIRLVADTNLVSVMTTTKVFLPMLLDAHGHVVNVASLAGRYALPGASVYTAAKHGVVAFSESLYHELRPQGVVVTSVNPGLVATEGFFPADSPLWRDRLVRPFIMSPERVARTIVHVVRTRKGPEVSVPRWLAAPQAARVLAPPLYRAALARVVSGRAGTAKAPEA
ncbi:MAG TPA: SDR family NAD(P)-dependent oxidoreductase [Actinomycetota bacterium]|nr:SDR family NAD(P)-dependent oxidoreductase [Actinomycetota bacterium]